MKIQNVSDSYPVLIHALSVHACVAGGYLQRSLGEKRGYTLGRSSVHHGLTQVHKGQTMHTLKGNLGKQRLFHPLVISTFCNFIDPPANAHFFPPIDLSVYL